MGEIIIGKSDEGFSVDETAPDDFGGGENAFIFNATTRTYPLLAETAEEKRAWVEVLRKAILHAGSSHNGTCLDATYNTE